MQEACHQSTKLVGIPFFWPSLGQIILHFNFLVSTFLHLLVSLSISRKQSLLLEVKNLRNSISFEHDVKKKER